MALFPFSETVNEYLGEELVNEGNEQQFLMDFHKKYQEDVDGLFPTENNVGEQYVARVKVWDKVLPIVLTAIEVEDGSSSTEFEISIDFVA